MKSHFLLFIVLILLFHNPCISMQRNPHCEINRQRWSQLIYVQAQMQQKPLLQQNLFDQAQELAATPQLVTKIKKSKKFSQKPYAADAKKALITKLIAQELVKEAKLKNKQIQEKKESLTKKLSKNKRKRMELEYTKLRNEKNKLLERAQQHYLLAASLYIKIYDLSEKKRNLNRAQTILEENLYDVELEIATTSHIFTIYNDKMRLYRKIQKRKGTLQ